MAGQLNINASESTIENILSRSDRYTVPEYQRLYSWGENQWEDFWRDLTSIEGNDTHFLGSIVVIKHTGSFGEMDTLDLVDGQQRLTTISIILAAIREQYRKEGNPKNLVEKIDDDYLHAYDMSNEKHQNLTLSKTDNEDFQHILEGNPEKAEGSQLYEAYEYFAQRLDNTDFEDVDLYRKRLLDSMTLVVIDTENPESAFRLFETLNDRGLELSAVDLMKNSLLQEAMETYPGGHDDPQYEHVRDQWETIIKDVIREINKPNRFFRHFIMSAPEPERNTSISNYKLYDEFRKIIKDELPTENVTLADYVDQMVDVSDLYMGLIKANTDEFESRNQEKINRRIENLNAVRSVHSRTLLLRAFQEVDDFSDLDQILRLLEVFMTRWKMAGYPSGSKLDSIFASLTHEAFDGNSDPVEKIKSRLKEEAPDDDEFRVGLRSKEFKQNDQTRYILQTLETRGYGGRDVNWTDIDIEHILPRKFWSQKKYQRWRQVTNIGEEEKDEYVDSLGNLTVLESRHNAEAGAKPFEEKKQYYLSSDYEMTQAVREIDEWNKKEIKEREEDLADMCVEVWDFESF